MRRRAFLAALGCAAAAWPPGAGAQQANTPRVGFVWFGSPEHDTVVADGLKKGLADRGYVLGRDLVFDERYAEGKLGQLSGLIAELLASGVDILVPLGNGAALLAHRATATVPIVCLADDLVGLGLAASLERPGGNVTGIDAQTSVYRTKWLELLKAVAPNLSQVAVLLSNPDESPTVMKLNEAAARFGLTLTFLSSRPSDLESSLASVAAGRFDGLIVNDNPSLRPQVRRIIALVAESRTPTL